MIFYVKNNAFNFRSFDKIEFNLWEKIILQKIAFIYGENGSENKPIIYIDFLQNTLNTMIFQDFLLSQGQDYLKKNPLNQLQIRPFFIFSLNDLIRENKLIGSNDKMEIILNLLLIKCKAYITWFLKMIKLFMKS